MARKWTEEEKRKQSEAIKRWKPWEQSTGPRTEEGKGRCSINAIKEGARCRIDDDYRRLFRLNRELRQLALKIVTEGNPGTLRKTNKLLFGEKK